MCRSREGGAANTNLPKQKGIMKDAEKKLKKGRRIVSDVSGQCHFSEVVVFYQRSKKAAMQVCRGRVLGRGEDKSKF
jgi:hypothetical protein